MNKQSNVPSSVLIKALTALTMMVLVSVIYFVVKEALLAFGEVAMPGFLLGQRRTSVAYTEGPFFGIPNFIATTLYVSLVVMVLTVTVGMRVVTYLSYATTQRMQEVLYPFADPLAGTPSTMCGFVGLAPMVRLFIRTGVHTDSCILAAKILLAVMLLPSLISSCSETMLGVRKRYQPMVDALGISRRHMVAIVILPRSWKNILLSVILAIDQAIGETTAVMMVTGDVNLFPFLLDKSESITAVIALEVRAAVVGSTHYHALRMAGLILMLLLFLINSGIALL